MFKESQSYLHVLGFYLTNENLILNFVKAHTEQNFTLNVEVLEKLTPLFFTLDHVNYA